MAAHPHSPAARPPGRTRAGLLVVALLLAGGTGGCGGGDEKPGAQRIVLIVADTLRRDHVAPYEESAPVPTPNLGRLAARGTVFRHAVSSFHQTTMSMSALFTGRTPSLETGEPDAALPWTRSAWCGLARLVRSEEDSCIPASVDTLAEQLHAAGYETLGVVSNRLLFHPLGYEQGFDVWVEVGEAERPKDRQSRRVESRTRAGDRVNEQVFAALDRRRSDRFFLYVHYIDPHDYGVREDLPRYEDGVAYLDRVVGQLMDGLEERGLVAGTSFVFTADHGERLGEQHALEGTPKHFGNPSFEPLLRVPLIVAPPVAWDPDTPLRSQDLPGLVREIAGLPARPQTETVLAPDELFVSEQFFRTYRRGRFKSLWPRNGKPPTLFDLETDPGETRDVAAAHPALLEAHRERVDELTRELASLHGRDAALSADDVERLRALGYLDEADAPPPGPP